jgi:histidyl-tRNA synthetase
MLGVHADITPQIARIDAKQGSDKISKYCYVNAILQTKADDFYTSRSPIQAGAELYGSNSIDADIEVIVLMLESLKLLAIELFAFLSVLLLKNTAKSGTERLTKICLSVDACSSFNTSCAMCL